MINAWTHNLVRDWQGARIRCYNCNTETKIHDPEKVTFFVCPRCRCSYNCKDDKSTATKTKVPNRTPVIPLQSKGIIEGKEYTVIGCVNKHEAGDKHATWQEYTLIDTNREYVYLSHSYGHWIFLTKRELHDLFKEENSRFVGNDTLSYELFSTYKQIAVSATGEFPEEVMNVQKIVTKEFISPPHLFACETRPGGNKYFQGKYMYASEIKKCFKGVELNLPERQWVGSCQPFYLGIKPKRFATLSLILAVITLPFIFAFGSDSNENPLVHAKAELSNGVHQQQVVSPAFDVEGSGAQLLRFDSYSDIDNDWIEAEISLVNESTGAERTFVSGIEYYHGYDDEGSWSEGEASHSNYIANVDPGKYHIEMQVSGANTKNLAVFQLNVVKDSAIWWNYLILMGTLAVICLVILHIHSNFEAKRYGTVDEDDE